MSGNSETRSTSGVTEGARPDGVAGTDEHQVLVGATDASGTSSFAHGADGSRSRSGGSGLAGAGGSSYVSLGHTAAHHVRLIAITTVLGLVCGIAAALVYPPAYTAEARIVVGTNATLANVQASAGLPAAEDSFAAEYARLVTSATVTSDVARRLHEGHIGGSLSASPIPQSPIIMVDATAPRSAAAVRLAQAGAVSLLAAVNKLNDGTAATVKGLLAQYVQAETALGAEQARVRSLQTKLDATPSSSPAVGTLRSEFAAAQGAAYADQLEATALSNQYQNQYSPYQQAEETVKISGPAIATGSDRKKALEIGLLAGLVGGAVVGLAVAAVGDIRRHLSEG